MGLNGVDGEPLSEGLALLLQRESGSCLTSEKADAELSSVVAYCLDLEESEVVNCKENCVDYTQVQHILQQRSLLHAEPAQERAESSGRVGPSAVTIDQATTSGQLVYDFDGLALESLENFSSCRATTCAFKGRWMYEVTVSTEGIQQLGWATIACPFTSEHGVGDAPDSYAFDGKRLKKWSMQHSTYGEAWVTNDIIGCCIDLDQGHISFHRNGHSMGVAYDNVRTMQPSAAYFPAISLSYGERCELNFGARPFQHPVPGFQPLHQPPPPSQQSAAARLLTCFKRVVKLYSRASSPEATAVHLPRASLSANDATLLTASLAHHLAPLLASPYLVHSHLLPTLLDLHASIPPHCSSAVSAAVRLLQATLPPPVFSAAIGTLLSALCVYCKTGPLLLLGEQVQAASYPYLALTAALARTPAVRAVWVAHPHFFWITRALLTRKPPTTADLKLLVPQVWWPGCSGGAVAQQALQQSMSSLAAAIDAVDAQMLSLMRSLLAARWPGEQSGRTALEALLEHLVRHNQEAARDAPPAGLSDQTVLNSVFFVLLRLLHPHLVAAGQGQGGLATFPIGRLFVEEGGGTGSGYLADPLAALPRLGGIVSHLSREVQVPACDLEDVALEAPHPMMPSPSGVSEAEEEAAAAAAALPPQALPKLLAAALLLYTWRVGPSVRMAHGMVVQGANTRATLEELSRHLGRPGLAPDYRQYLTQMRSQLCEELTTQTRLLALCQPALLSPAKQEAMFSAATYLAAIIRAAADRGPLLGWLPNPCMELPVDLLAWLRHSDTALAPPAALEVHGLQPLLGLLARLLDDPRICYPEVKDSLLSTMASLLESSSFRGVLERNEEVRQCLVPTVLRSFDTKLWHPVSIILQRLLRSSGFGQVRLQQVAPLSVFQRQVQEACLSSSPAAQGFMNRLFNTLNWCLTEFAVIITDVYDHPTRWTQPSYLQDPSVSVKKCIIMFDLSCQLLRTLEFVAREAPAIFFLPSRLNLTRLLEVVGFVLAHFTVGPDARRLREVLQRAPSEGAAFLALDRISLPPILAPVVGILVGLGAAPADQPPATPSSATSPACAASASSSAETDTAASDSGRGSSRGSVLVEQLAGSSNSQLPPCLDFLPSLDWRGAFPSDPTLPLHLQAYDQLLEQVRSARAALEATSAAMVAGGGRGGGGEPPEDFLDPITLEVMADPVVLPDSGVTVERGTILRHLLSQQNDPFSRKELQPEMLKPNAQLAARIHAWRAGAGPGEEARE